MRDNDPISDLMSKEGLSYPEAVERLAGGERGDAVGAMTEVDGPIMATLVANNDALRAVLEGLVDRLEEIHADPAYQTVWTVNQIHAGPYRGPTYAEALARAKAELRRA